MSENKSQQHSLAGKASAASLTPEQRTDRARRGAAQLHSLDNYVRKVVARAPELTAEQRDQLAAILRSGVTK